ncbi:MULTISPECIES: LuxR C-terminal-related transcriptional regulator [unclassified Erwinia]|uniref:helix-turn-helix transcriptional regulator n=1 Tax=unclassified Erwinia TaxID=2622719 RepID=UPI000833050D|nr:LuxR C-terminal-related transcriptional regulator [Erwinia sp. ErVv1]
MNILIVSTDHFFISGAVALVSQAWPNNLISGPVFILSETEDSFLTPDIIITDVNQTSPALETHFPRAIPLAGRIILRHVTIFFARQCREEHGDYCPLHHIYLHKRESAKGLQLLFTRRNPAIMNANPSHRSQLRSPLSKQQAMVVRYTSEGMSLTDISRLTQLSVKTISTHKRAVMRKLGIKNNSEFYQYALAGYLNN